MERSTEMDAKYTAVCPSCGTRYEGKDNRDGEPQAYDPLRGEWTTDCPSCGAPNLERCIEDGDDE